MENYDNSEAANKAGAAKLCHGCRGGGTQTCWQCGATSLKGTKTKTLMACGKCRNGEYKDKCVKCKSVKPFCVAIACDAHNPKTKCAFCNGPL